jgi:2-polyprenyl-3-methyl-5-hydroxy-6-metoxy-1,4-benzoquinol methylase
VDLDRFSSVYRGAVRDIARFVTPDRQLLMARHNSGLHPERLDLVSYLRLSEARYMTALQTYLAVVGGDTGHIRALDAGVFLGTLPLALARLGVRVTLSEAYGYYEGAFDDLRAYLESEGITVWDLDLTESNAAPAGERFDVVFNMAMIEHLADSPRPLMENLRALLAREGRLVIDVPNIAYWPRRLQALRGQSVHPPLSDVFYSESPYIGHHREYTLAELRSLFQLSGLEVDRLVTFNYSWNYQGPALARLKARVLYEWPMRRFKSLREVLLACGSVPNSRKAPTLPH